MTAEKSAPGDLDAAIAERLEQFIDPHLEAIGMPLCERPFAAAMEMVERFVIGVQLSGALQQKPGDSPDFIATPWFRIIFRTVEQWYQARLGLALVPKKDTISGAVLIYGVPFRIAVPATFSRPGKRGDGELMETVWLRFPDTVLENEVEGVTSWLVSPPSLAAMPQAQIADVRQRIIEVATALRSIRTNFMGAGGEGDLLALQKGTVAHLEAFVDLIQRQEPTCIQKAYWEIQMACESAFKAVTLQRTGQFRETHDLFKLYDDLHALRPLGISRDKLKGIPRWEEMVDLRYAQGRRENLAECVKCYRVALAVTEAVVAEAGPRRLLLGNAEFELGCPPWFKD